MQHEADLTMAVVTARRLPRTLAAPRLNLRLAMGIVILSGALLGLVAVYRGAQPRTVDVVRAARDLAPGQVIQVADLQVASEALPDEVSKTLVTANERATLAGRRLAQPLNAGDFVTRRQVESMTRVLGPDERLYALAIPSETVAGLRLQASDRVEIVVTTNKARPEQAETRVVLPVVSIFSVGNQESSAA